MAVYDQWLSNSDMAICMNIETFAFLDRGQLSVNLLSQLRNLLDHICVKIYVDNGRSIKSNYYELIKAANKYVGSEYKYREIKRFHDMLQISASHYTLDPENSERLMLKYYEKLLKIKKIMREDFGLEILHNINKFPLKLDPEFAAYYKAISERIENINLSNAQTEEQRFYIYKTKPFFVEDEIYYEVTFSPASERASKFDRIIAFSKFDILPNYASYLRLTESYIKVLGVNMPILIIVGWMPAIRICEFKNLAKILGLDFSTHRTKEYENTMAYLRSEHCTLLDVVNFDNAMFGRFLRLIQGGPARHISTMLIRCRNLITAGKDGSNIIRYLLFRMNNKVIKDQFYNEPCGRLSKLNLTVRSKPFDTLPFSFSLVNHNPLYNDLLSSIPLEGHESELLSRFLANNAEHKGTMYTPVSEIPSFIDAESNADDYNSRLYRGHPHAKILISNDHAFINKYDDNVYNIIQKLKTLTETGVEGYTAIVDSWLSTPGVFVDSDEKRNALRSMFAKSKVAFIFGAAGTGKTTLINHLSNVLHDKNKLYLANTNPAVENLKRRVRAANSSCMTIYSYIRRKVPCDVLFIDECSTVSNEDMLEILNINKFRLLVLVGDMYQIEAIRFGNWFGICNSHFKGDYKVDLVDTYRTTCPELIETWKQIRTLSDCMLEHITRNGYSHRLDHTIFDKSDEDEVVLCLNYGGLYGINNINRFLQSNNSGEAIKWGIHVYKKGDPILFTETERFPQLFNNLKGEIVDFCIVENTIVFTLKVFTVLTSLDLEYSEIEYVSPADDGESTIIKITVDADGDGENDIDSDRSVVPFQIAYAISIHKAQGLEYKSVKVVITHDVEDMITHNIFYTAVTRTKEKLKIYWSPETENKILGNMKLQFNRADYDLLRKIHPDIMK